MCCRSSSASVGTRARSGAEAIVDLCNRLWLCPEAIVGLCNRLWLCPEAIADLCNRVWLCPEAIVGLCNRVWLCLRGRGGTDNGPLRESDKRTRSGLWLVRDGIRFGLLVRFAEGVR